MSYTCHVLTCTKDFVSRNADFQQFVTAALRTAHSIPSSDLTPESLLDAPVASSNLRAALGDLTLKIRYRYELCEFIHAVRENIVLRRVASVTAAPGSVLATYVHNKLEGSDDIQVNTSHFNVNYCIRNISSLEKKLLSLN